jgi:hypothetical protein
MTRYEKIEALAQVFAKARGCFEDGAAAAKTGFPCPFCHWTVDAGDESGCITWAEIALEALEPAQP